jgi:ElaB/YqjD/DUF883 family membrane-anchored ribosome-binding protein
MFGSPASEKKMDQTGPREIAKETIEETRDTANASARQTETAVQRALDRGKSVLQDLTSQASETSRQAMGRASEFIDSVAPKAKQAASNLYEQGTRSGDYLRQYVTQEPLAAMLVAGAVGFTLGYLIFGARKQRVPGDPPTGR